MAVIVSHEMICNEALAMFGGGRIQSFDEEKALSRQCKAIYFPKLDALMSLEWSFNGRTYKLDEVARVAENGYDATAKIFQNGWRYGYQLPGTRLGLPRRLLTSPQSPDNPLRRFAIEEAQVYCEERALWALVNVRAAPDAWTPMFRLAATTALASALCVPVSSDTKTAAVLREAAEGSPDDLGRGGLIGQALAFDAARARPKAPEQTDPFTAARLS